MFFEFQNANFSYIVKVIDKGTYFFKENQLLKN